MALPALLQFMILSPSSWHWRLLHGRCQFAGGTHPSPKKEDGMSSDLKQHFSEIFYAGFIKQALVQALMPHQDRLFCPSPPGAGPGRGSTCAMAQRPRWISGARSW